MISISDVANVIYAIIPLYVALTAGYLSLKLWKLFTPVQCSGINKFVSKVSIPLLSFQVISTSNPFKMNLRLILADSLQKLIALIVLAIIVKIIRLPKGSLDWIITGFSVSTLPNTLIIGIPLIQAMYGDEAAKFLVQIVVLQSIVWYNVLLILFEFTAAKDVASLKSASEVSGHVEASQELEPEDGDEINNGRVKAQTKEIVTVILSTVAKKLITNLNTYATFAGLIWASIHFRWDVKMPKVIEDSIKTMSDGGLGMAMFSVGLFMASQDSFIACGTKKTLLSIAMKFLAGPILMAMSSTLLGLRGTLLKVAIVQAALPQGIVPFVFAKEYNVHADILSTGVIVGMLLAIPIGLAYYFLLAL